MDEKEYFFISHSHLDIKKVRIVRNTIEQDERYEPILFFLRCIEDDEELNDLLKREIRAREWFIYCKSNNAERSAYVQRELAYIRSLKAHGYAKNVLTIDLDALGEEEIAPETRRQTLKKHAFISCSQYDAPFAARLYDALSRRGFSVWTPRSCITSSGAWAGQIGQAICRVAENDGVHIVLLSDRSVRSRSVALEMDMGARAGALMIPVLLVDGAGKEKTVSNCGDVRAIEFPVNGDCDLLVDQIVAYRFSG